MKVKHPKILGPKETNLSCVTLPSLFCVSPHLPPTQFAWKWKTQVWNGGIYIGSHALIKAFPRTVHMCVHLCACVHICVCVCSSPDRPLEITSLYPAVYWRMVVTSHTPAKPKSHDRSHQLAHHMQNTQKFQKTNVCEKLCDLRSFMAFVYFKI